MKYQKNFEGTQKVMNSNGKLYEKEARVTLFDEKESESL